MAFVDFKCFGCGNQFKLSDEVGRRDECETCGADLHCCKNCRFYDSTAYNECKEVQADVVQVKDRSNFCDYFQLGQGSNGEDNKKDLLAAAEALFKK